MVFYPLTDKRHAEIVAEIAQRRGDTENGIGTTPASSPADDVRLSTAALRTGAKRSWRDGRR
jgi:hypothetical protein